MDTNLTHLTESNDDNRFGSVEIHRVCSFLSKLHISKQINLIQVQINVIQTPSIETKP